MRINLLNLTVFMMLTTCYSQKAVVKEESFRQRIDTIVEELKFNYEYDQALREYLLYKTFDKAFTDSIEGLKSEESLKYIYSTNFKSDLATKIWKEFINPTDDKFTENLIAISDSVGYPSLKRIRKYYSGVLPAEFNPVIFFVHSPQKYWPKIIEIAEREFKIGNMGKCDYGYIRWHTSARKDNKFLEDHGIKFWTNSNGRAISIQTCEDE